MVGNLCFVDRYVDNFVSQHGDHMSTDQLCVLLASEVQKAAGLGEWNAFCFCIITRAGEVLVFHWVGCCVSCPFHKIPVSPR